MVFDEPGQPLACRTIPDPEPGEGELVIKVARCGICGTDLHRSEPGLLTYGPGTVMGHEFSGEVVALGPGVTAFRAGDRVTALPYIGCNQCAYCRASTPNFCSKVRNIGTEAQTGAYAEYVKVAAPFTVRMPAELSFDDGALVEPFAVGLHAVLRAGLTPQKKVLVLGAGPIGLAVAWWARRAGASTVAVQASSGRRANIARDLGADHFLVPEPDRSPVEQAVDALGGRPDVVFECVGAPGIIDQALKTVAVHGTIVVLGVCAHMDHWLPAYGLVTECDIRFSTVYSLDDYRATIEALRAAPDLPRRLVTRTVGLAEMPAAFQALRGPSSDCKVMLDPWRTELG